jgi:hypothetical protein
MHPDTMGSPPLFLLADEGSFTRAACYGADFILAWLSGGL